MNEPMMKRKEKRKQTKRKCGNIYPHSAREQSSSCESDVNNDRWDIDGTMPRKGKYQQFIRTIYSERNGIEFLGLIWRLLRGRIIF